jgi:glycosyltransferase involved in cell wall biosynthesis
MSQRARPTIGVILSTYNWPHALELALWGYAAQTQRDFQLVVADDGSGAETAELIEHVQHETGLDLLHVWQEDRGFRKSEVLNRAIMATDRDYLIFSDGDTIPGPNFVALHAAFAERGRFLAGAYVKLNRAASEAITVDDVRAGRATRLRWLRAHGFRPGKHALRFVGSGWLGALLDRVTPTPARFHGNNASTWRDYIIEVNGFDMEMGYGGQDAALGDRLENLGVLPKRIRHRVVAVHLHHERPWQDPAGMRRNQEIRFRIRKTGETRAVAGIQELEAAKN